MKIRNFGQKSKLWLKIENFLKNPNFAQKPKFWLKIEASLKNGKEGLFWSSWVKKIGSWFLTKILIFHWNFVFLENFEFFRNFRFVTKISIFNRIFDLFLRKYDFRPKFWLLIQISFFTKMSFLLNVNSKFKKWKFFENTFTNKQRYFGVPGWNFCKFKTIHLIDFVTFFLIHGCRSDRYTNFLGHIFPPKSTLWRKNKFRTKSLDEE